MFFIDLTSWIKRIAVFIICIFEVMHGKRGGYIECIEADK